MSRKYALFVGSSEYDAESLSDLKSPISDVQDLANLFRDSAIGGFDEVTELINRTESEIRQAIGSFFLQKKPEDLLLLYFSGHGVLDDRGHLYLAVKDTNPDLLRATSISADFIADDMDLCRSKRQILILDCCHSGAFRRGIKGGGKAVTATTFEGNGSGRIVLTASDRREFAMEGHQVLEQAKTSLFTHFLLEGIKSGEADRDGDSFISLDEWYDYAYDKVVSNLPTQTPRRWVYNQEGRLIIARNPRPDKIKPAELARGLRESIEDQRPKIRLRAISELSDILNSENKQLALAAREALVTMQKDDNSEVKDAAAKVLSDHDSRDSFKPTVIQPDSVNIWNKLWMLFPDKTVKNWKTWVVSAAIAAGVVFAGRGLYTAFKSTNTAGGEKPPNTEQAELGAAGNLITSPEESDKNGKTDESLSTRKDNQPEGKETNSDIPPLEQQPPGDKEENDPAESTDSDQQNATPGLTQEGNTGEPEGENNPDKAEERPLDRLQNQIDELQNNIEKAIMEEQWADIPVPLTDFYKKLFDNFYKNFNIIKVESTAGKLASDEATATLPVTIEISYQQKGREDIKPLPIPANWVWKKGEAGFVLSHVERL